MKPFPKIIAASAAIALGLVVFKVVSYKFIPASWWMASTPTAAPAEPAKV